MKPIVWSLLLSLPTILSAVAADEKPPTEAAIESDQLRAAWDAQAGSFRLADVKDKAFAHVVLEEFPQQITAGDWNHARLGSGRMLEATLPGGDRVRVILAFRVPFALLQTQMAAGPEGERVVHDTKPFRLTLDLPDGPDALKALGTAGLTAPDAHPGSYAFLARCLAGDALGHCLRMDQP